MIISEIGRAYYLNVIRRGVEKIPFWSLAMPLFSLNILDWHSTVLGFAKGCEEQNPFGNLLIGSTNMNFLLFIKIIVSSFLISLTLFVFKKWGNKSNNISDIKFVYLIMDAVLFSVIITNYLVDCS